MPFASVNSFAGLGYESTPGTASTLMKWLPVTTPQVTPMQTFLRDEAYRGSPTTVYSQVAGVRHDEYEAKFYLYPESFPLLAFATLGKDTPSGSGTYTHTVKLLNDATTGSQPPSLTVQDFDGQQAFQMTDAQMADLKLTFGAEAPVEATAKFVGNPVSQITTPSGVSIPTTTFVPGWDVAVSLGGSASSVLVDGEINMTRGTTPIFTAGTQAPYKTFAGPLDVSGRMRFVVESTDPMLLTANGKWSLVQLPKVVALTFTEPSTSTTTIITMSQVQFHDAKRDRGKAFVEVEAQFTAQANATDADTGYSPIKIVSTNSIASYTA